MTAARSVEPFEEVAAFDVDEAVAVVVCEMLDEADGALSPTAARAYADRNDLVYVEGSDLLERFD